MKILFDNLVIGSTLTSTNASNNYPPANLQDTSLIRRLQSSLDWDSVTIQLDETGSISDVFWGYTSAAQIVLRFYDYEGVLLYTHTITNPDSWIGHEAFPVVSGVDYVELYFDGDLDVYLGGLGLGVAVTMPDPLASWRETPEDNSVVSESPHGQTNQDYIRPLRQLPFEFPAVMTREQTDTIEELVNGVGKGFPLWVDPFEDNHDFMKPIYAKITEAVPVTKDGRTYGFALSLKEAR